MTAEAMRNQEVCDAWDHRHVGVERAKAGIALAQDFLVRELASGTPRLAEVEQAKRWMTAMGVAMASKHILADAQRRMIREADEMRHVDETITADRAAIAHYMRSASQGKIAAEPAPAFSQMSEAEFKKHTRENYGF
jgi:hypothetical protein